MSTPSGATRPDKQPDGSGPGVGVPTSVRDAFDVLGLVPGFDLTVAEIRAAYLARAAAAHAGGDEGASARLNGAMQQVQDPLTRGGLLLARLGGPSDAADRSTPDGFLGELLDARERAQDARSAGRLQVVKDLVTWAQAGLYGEIAGPVPRSAGLGPPASAPPSGQPAHARGRRAVRPETQRASIGRRRRREPPGGLAEAP
ncbi:MAG: hypothetical protein ACK5UW_09870, partial [bacterium]